MHNTPLITTIVAGLVLAFLFGALFQRLRLPPLVGYLVAGILVGPFTPGLVADQNLANELAEIGVILLMFGVGLHFSLKDLMTVRKIAVPGAVTQIAAATLMGMGLAAVLGWSMAGGFVFGLALSVASTVVLLRALEERRLMDTERGRIAIGWLIVEDLAMVLALVLIPAIAASIGDAKGAGSIGIALLITVGKVGAFIAFMLVVGRRVIPAMLDWVAKTGSRELFSLAVLAIALGVALGAASLFGVSFALGAFFAGMILHESPLSHRAAEESLPLRDAFAVLFFVSVGMLFDPGIVLRAPWPLLATLLIIMVGKSIAAFMIVRLFGRSKDTAMTISASLAQIGEFSFILAALGVSLGLLPEEGRDLILAGAILSILLNPLAFTVLGRHAIELPPEVEAQPVAVRALPRPTALSGHAVIVGYGRVGSTVAASLREREQSFVVIEDRPVPMGAAREDDVEIIFGNGADPLVLQAANVAGAQYLFVAIPRSFDAGQIVRQAHAANPALKIIARAHSDAEVTHLQKCGATQTIMGEREIALGMLDLAFTAAATDEPPAPFLTA